MILQSFNKYLFFFSIALLPISLYANSGNGIPAETKPSADVTLSFVQPGQIAKVNIREGDSVNIGDILVQQDDSVEKVSLAILEAQSKDKTQIQAAEARLEQSKIDLKRREDKPLAVTASEIDYARLNMNIAELSLRLTILENEQAQKKYEEAKLQIERMSLKSPIEGWIEKIEIETGESVNALDDVVRVVRIDPLWIDVDIPLTQRANLKYGDTAMVEFSTPDITNVEGTVIFIPAVADFASTTIRIRIQVPNKTNRPAGERVLVTLPSTKP